MQQLSERLLSPAAYITVLVILVLLTILTVGLSFVPSSGLMRIVARAIDRRRQGVAGGPVLHARPAQHRADAGRDRRDHLLVSSAVGIDLQRLFHAGMIPESARTLANVELR